jgi:hypothetical protein
MTEPIPRAVMALAIIVSGLLLANSQANAEKQPPFEELLTEYKKLGMPLPPDGAKLVRFATGWRQEEKEYYSFGFLLKKGSKKEDAVVLCGAREITVEDPARVQEIKPDLRSLTDLFEDPGIPGEAKFLKITDYLPLSIQFYDRGFNEVADRLLELARKNDERPLKGRLVAEAWEYWKHRVSTPKIDRTPIAEGLHAIILLDKELDTVENRVFVRALDASLVPSKAKQGSVEALIDDLVDFGSDSREAYEQKTDRYSRIRKLGFEAVPALIQHLNDDRLTRSYRPTTFFNNSITPAHFVTIRALVGELLCDNAGRQAAKEWDDPPSKAQVQQWWEVAKRNGEEAYLLQNVLPKEDERIQPDSSLIETLALRYPNHLASIFRTVLEKRHDLDTQDLAIAINKSALPKEVKIELFSLAAMHKNYHHRCLSLGFLSELDNRQFSRLLLATIEGLPKDLDDHYWACAEVRAANLIIHTDDAKVWKALETSAKRSEVGLRMELIRLKDYGDLSPQTRQVALRFLASFLDDSTARDVVSNKEKFILCAGGDYKRLEVRDFAALEISRIVGTDVPVNPERTPKEWAKVREKAMEAVRIESSGDRKP